MTDTADWQKLAGALRDLHRALIERARRDHERAHGVALGPVERLQSLVPDPFCDWLHG